jgi:hypothetical protein
VKPPKTITAKIVVPEWAKLIAAAKRADWGQVVQNGGPPCFHLDSNGKFCLRAERWFGHGSNLPDYHDHKFVPLHEMLESTPPRNWRKTLRRVK